MEGPLSRAMATWICCIDRFESQYYKVFTGHSLFGADIVDQIHKQLQVLIHSCNTMSLEDVEMGALAEFGYLKRRLERGDWTTPPPRLGRDSGAKSRW